MKRLILSICLAMAVTLFLAAVSEAHKVNIFAYVEGNTVVTDSGYSKSKRVYDGIVEVYDVATGTLLLSGSTNQQGRFDFEIPEAAHANHMDLRLLLKAGTGHQAEWVVKYAEYGTDTAPAASAKDPAAVQPTAVTSSVGSSEVEKIVHRELEPVKRMLAEMHDAGPSMTEIIGGIGWIIGLFGVAAYMKGRRQGK
ncbi:hypothetical protein [Pseudodesulfovibrio sediminis]|uniref:Nickel transport protein n=1 Tax=Pseudodesulfovibrio sediminis TaxID=2810563 RepID=A0ABN6ET50_9BACT|nr:hypothetical protein [Pseudodesulfovibrio sediminis]BCS88334.1 hypothetical protein PSDVSF_15760 [Pseudodesulfovibrio sediminis]